jgi:predicted HicB family RNase H-like nuclease
MLELEKNYPSVNKTFRIPINIVEQLEYLAGVNNTSVNKVVIQCLQYALDHIQENEEE